jgi:hypothetical protein
LPAVWKSLISPSKNTQELHKKIKQVPVKNRRNLWYPWPDLNWHDIAINDFKIVSQLLAYFAGL